MSWTAFILAALKALPALIALISAIKTTADAKVNQGIGYDQAVQDGLESAAAQLRLADEAVEEAKQRQAKHPGDDEGRDIQFRRD